MYETEIKILDINREETERRLIAAGAKKTFDGELHAIYYDLPDHSVRKNKGVFRLRKEGSRCVLTFKKYVSDRGAKVREEKEVAVSDFDAMKSIIESLGFSGWLDMRKHRTTYELEGLHFEFDKYCDEYDYIPEFLEIEGSDTDTIYRYAEMLGFGKEDCRPWDAVQVAEYYSRRKSQP